MSKTIIMTSVTWRRFNTLCDFLVVKTAVQKLSSSSFFKSLSNNREKTQFENIFDKFLFWADIDVDNSCWRQRTTVTSLRCWWQILRFWVTMNSTTVGDSMFTSLQVLAEKWQNMFKANNRLLPSEPRPLV